MLGPRIWRVSWCLLIVLAGIAARAAEEDALSLLDKAIEVKLTAENVTHLNEVIQLCEEALDAGLDPGNTKIANELLASTLTQRAELVCMELFDRPVRPNQARKLLEMALADLEQTLKLDAEQAEAQYLLGRLCSHLGESEKALAALDAAVRLAKEEPALCSKSLLLRANLKKDPAARLADYNEAVKLAPHDADVLRFRGMFHLTQEETAAAIADLKAAVALDPKDADTHEALGIALSSDQKYDDALQSLDKAIELAPESSTAYTHRARLRAIKGDAPAALKDVESSLKLQPGSVDALLLHAALLGSLGKYDQALADLSLLRKAMPDNAEVLLQIAMIYQVTRQPQKAIATYDTLLVADPDNTAAYRGRADTHLGLGQQAEAIADYRAALEQDPKNSGVLNNLAWVLATSPDESLRDGKDAIELAKLACEVTEYKQAHILSTLAASYAETGDFDSAISWSKKAVDLGTGPVKAQLGKELESYEHKQPWREETPPPDALAPEQTVSPEKNAPASDDTARSKRAG